MEDEGPIVPGLHSECRVAGGGSGPQPHTKVVLVKME